MLRQMGLVNDCAMKCDLNISNHIQSKATRKQWNNINWVVLLSCPTLTIKLKFGIHVCQFYMCLRLTGIGLQQCMVLSISGVSPVSLLTLNIFQPFF